MDELSEFLSTVLGHGLFRFTLVLIIGIIIIAILITIISFTFFLCGYFGEHLIPNIGNFIGESNKKNKIINRLNNVTKTIYKKNLTIEESYNQLLLNYTQICRNISHSEFASILDVFETIIHYYDLHSCKQNRGDTTNPIVNFNPINAPEIRNFIFEIRNYIKAEAPFISVTEKEANLLQALRSCIQHN